ncbi:methyl-accepting chemotaxis protein [Rivihabitans pingtungensis]|uniref:methyl-accepting chemotaxis protein n=1 Tax=Rivihabitans pingtungensis TaxID=1054498 RepID=UPI002355B9D4|nr:methyl-accepting chemotaxis protein [Rivihabitans pingtungensis]MCK6438513.1 methyl-accepting chemotaxis protein [Rivihabitans pingtungensis]
MNALKVSTRLYLLTGVLLAVSVAIALLGLRGMEQVVAGLDSVYKDRVVPLRDIKLVSDAYLALPGRLVSQVESREQSGPQAAQALTQQLKLARQHWHDYLATYLVEDEQREIAKLKPLLAEADRQLDGLIVVLNQQNPATLADYPHQELERTRNAMQAPLDRLVAVQLEVAKAEYDNSLALYHASQRNSLILLALSLLLGVGFVLWMARTLGRQLGAEPQEVAEVAARIAAGDLRTPIICQTPGSVMQAMQKMQTSLQHLLGQIQSGAEHLASAAASLAATVEQVAGSTSTQSESTASIAAAVEELTTSIGHISTSAQQAAHTASAAGALSQESGQATRAAISEVNNITTAVHHSAGALAELDGKSREISQVVNVIRDIADQTNLLALNAAIEAARAGESGRGFAVVADEVRKLAERTAASTGEISAMVNAIQADVEHARQRMSDGVSQVESGVERVATVGEVMHRLGGGIDETLKAIRDIANSLIEQGNASNAVAANVEKVAQMTEETSAAGHTLRDAAEGLNQLAASLRATVGRFQL